MQVLILTSRIDTFSLRAVLLLQHRTRELELKAIFWYKIQSSDGDRLNDLVYRGWSELAVQARNILQPTISLEISPST